MGVGVFTNVFLLNMSYDIPVKIFSFQLLFACLFLSLGNIRRITSFFLLNQSTTSDTSWEIPQIKPWFKPARILLKLLFAGCFVLYPFYRYYDIYASRDNRSAPPPFESGYYSVETFILNGDTISSEIGSKEHWQDFVIDNGPRGSIGLIDSASFRPRYGRSYFFNYSLDSLQQILTIKRFRGDSIPIFEGLYNKLEGNNMMLSGIYRGIDSLHVDLIWKPRNYQLARKEFNWMLESVP